MRRTAEGLEEAADLVSGEHDRNPSGTPGPRERVERLAAHVEHLAVQEQQRGVRLVHGSRGVGAGDVDQERFEVLGTQLVRVGQPMEPHEQRHPALVGRRRGRAEARTLAASATRPSSLEPMLTSDASATG